MKFAVIFLFGVFCLGFSSAQWNSRNFNYQFGRNTNLNFNGLNHQSNNGLHNANLNYGSVGYNYRGTQWSTNVNHNFRESHTSLNANYRGRHNFGVGHNWRNRQTTLGYTWNFGKRRRSTDIESELLEYLKTEQQPNIFLEKLQLAVDKFIKAYQNSVPELKLLSISFPDGQITNVTVAQETVCLVKKLRKIMPNKLGNFIVKMIKFHADSFDIKNLHDFYTVDPQSENEDACEIPKVPTSNVEVDPAVLWKIKKFVVALITAAMEYQ